MIFTKREEKLIKAFLDVGKLSIDDIQKILGVSQRTAYRTISDLNKSLSEVGISLRKEQKKFVLAGDLSQLSSFYGQEDYSRSERLNLICLALLMADGPLTNAYFQETLMVSNVTIIQDITDIEECLADFDIGIERKQGYQLQLTTAEHRYLLSVLLTNMISSADFKQGKFEILSTDWQQQLKMSKKAFREQGAFLPDMDPKLLQFFTILLASSKRFGQPQMVTHVSKQSLELAQKLYASYSKLTAQAYGINDIVYWAGCFDQLYIKRQENPLYVENFDSQYFYNVTNLIDKVSSLTKINFVKDKTLFHFLFHHLRLSLAIPYLFPDQTQTSTAHLVAYQNDFLHRIIRLVVKDLFPAYLQNEAEYELITLHFASSIRRSPDIYPIQVLLLTNQRPLAVELLISKIKSIAPFVQSVQVKRLEEFDDSYLETYDYVLATSPNDYKDVELISIYPNTSEILRLQDRLQAVQIERNQQRDRNIEIVGQTDLQLYLEASQALLERFQLREIRNNFSFEETVGEIIGDLPYISDQDYLTKKLLKRFAISPFAIPETGLVLLHTKSHTVQNSQFMVYQLEHEIEALSMNHEKEKVSRILVMLTKDDSRPVVKELMSAIGQSIIENHLYTEIYKTGNQEIIYQLLNKIFSETIKDLET
ncbi:phosphotransferase [Streptococcus sobrinus]|uniref:BglG family transcription antiterminator n=1 Tax=Streptococcus sobrinus TaxID=1310 RepID=UPI000BA1BA11|nr:HTH domain-containing protein [Streptococcus sobrinus]OZV23349.1 phosphotransferase [Streptococcus sobrinus]